MKNKFLYTAVIACMLSFCYSTSHAVLIWKYLYSEKSHVNSGCETTNGHLLAGYNVFPYQTNMIDFGPMVIHTNSAGYFASSTEFNRTYEFTISAAGYTINVNANRAIPMNSGNGYVSVGTFNYFDVSAGQMRYGILYIILDNNGNPVTYRAYRFAFNMADARITALRQANNHLGKENFLICGQMIRYGEDIDMFVVRFDDALNIIYDKCYDFFGLTSEYAELPNDIIESPYGNNQVLVVGEGDFNNNSVSKHDGFILALDALSGVVTGTYNFDLGGIEGFTGITDNSGDITDPGFGICGYQLDYTTGVSIPWLMKWNHSTNTQYLSVLYNNISRPNTEMKPLRLQHIYNPDPNVSDWTYSIGGNVIDLNNNNHPEVFILSTDKNGGVIYSGYYWDRNQDYVGHGKQPVVPYVYGNVLVDIYDPRTTWAFIANTAHPCDGHSEDMTPTPIPPTVQNFLQYDYLPFSSLAPNYLGYYDNAYWEYCQGDDFGAKNSTAVKSTALGDNEVKLYPNPVLSELNIDKSATDKADYIITNTLGMVISKGVLKSTHEVINISSYPAGVYVLSMTLKGQTKNYKFVKE